METCTTSADRIKSPALLTAAGFLLMLFPDSEVRTNRKTHLIYRLYSGEAPGVQEGGAQNKTNLPRSKGAVNPTGCAAAGCAMGCSAALPCSTKAAPERSKAVHSSYQHRAAPLTSLPGCPHCASGSAIPKISSRALGAIGLRLCSCGRRTDPSNLR